MGNGRQHRIRHGYPDKRPLLGRLHGNPVLPIIDSVPDQFPRSLNISSTKKVVVHVGYRSVIPATFTAPRMIWMLNPDQDNSLGLHAVNVPDIHKQMQAKSNSQFPPVSSLPMAGSSMNSLTMKTFEGRFCKGRPLRQTTHRFGFSVIFSEFSIFHVNPLS